MCGRYVVAYDPETLVSGFSVRESVPFPRQWNLTPQSDVPVVHETKEGERIAVLMRWGLVPHWARDAAIGHKLNNARAETAAEKPSFRQALRRRRCILPASGFYEWQATPSGKQPHYIAARSGEPLALAGLFEAWRPDDSAPWLLSCCILTTTPNAVMAPIHDRMPVILKREDWARWLSRAEQEAAAVEPLLVPAADDLLQARPVSRALNRGEQRPEVIFEGAAPQHGAPP
jgi:putative SOS response-associated peptidase YedK